MTHPLTVESIRAVAVLGSGAMGNGIAHVFTRAGYAVILRNVERSTLDRAVETISANLDRGVKKVKSPKHKSPPSWRGSSR